MKISGYFKVTQQRTISHCDCLTFHFLFERNVRQFLPLKGLSVDVNIYVAHDFLTNLVRVQLETDVNHECGTIWPLML